MSRRFLEPHPGRSGWIVAGTGLEGRLVWSDERISGAPYDVVVDGLTISWQELGEALEPYEGWVIRLEVVDDGIEVGPDAAVVPLSTGLVDASVTESGSPRIEALLDQFLADQRARLAERTYAHYETVVDLLRACLNGYGHQHLNEPAAAQFEAAFGHDEDAFIHLFGADELVAGIPEFLDYFMVRKVIAGADLLRSAGTVTKKLAKWLGERGYLDAAIVDNTVERGAEAARDLPRADRLSDLLYEAAEKSTLDLDTVSDDEVLDDYLVIERVEPEAVWFEGGIGPVRVPKPASDLARPGWTVNVVLVRVRDSWRLVEVGRVYP
jgi:hypothetical protein